MSRIIYFLLLVHLFSLTLSQRIRPPKPPTPEPPKDPDYDRNITELIKSRHFDYEQHDIVTKDGYVLAVFRIVNPLARKAGRPVILQHGLLSSGHDFIMNSPGGDAYERDTTIVGNNLGFELSKRGYDVWLANSRGNVYCRKHVSLTTASRSFWDFTYDQMIEFDLPATIDHVLQVTGRKTVGYVGHSQGTLIMFGLLSEDQKYGDIIKPFIALAPVTSVANAATPFKHLARIPFVIDILRMRGGEVHPEGSIVNRIASKLCNSKVKEICTNLMFMANGFSETQLNRTRVHVYRNHYPSGSSNKNIAHFAQSIKFGRFAKFDYGPDRNRLVYGTSRNPEYKIEKISNRDIILFSSENDWLASPGDVDNLVKRLGNNLLDHYVVPVKSWNHMDFLIGRDAGSVVYRRVLMYLSKYDE